MDGRTKVVGWSVIWKCLGAGGLLLAAGCGQKVPGPPSTSPVHGTVTYKGEPLHGGYIVFSPAGEKGVQAEGAIRADGGYDARAFVGQLGTTPGEYKVWFSPLPDAARGEAFADPMPIPEKYKSLETTDLTQTISDGDNAIDVEIPDVGGDAAGAAEAEDE